MTNGISQRTYGALILAGGEARRMGGQNKALLCLEHQTFLSHLEAALDGFDEKLISIRDPSWLPDTAFLPIPDEVDGRGPLEGLRCALQQCRSDALVVVPCDVPLFSAALAQALMRAGADSDVMICRDSSGKLHPLCGVYSKDCLPVIEAQAAQENFRIMSIWKTIGGSIFDLDAAGFSDDQLTNVNAPETFHSLQSV